MEEKDTRKIESDTEFIELLNLARNRDSSAILRLLDHFEEDMINLIRYIRMPNDDALQIMKTDLIELFQQNVK